MTARLCPECVQGKTINCTLEYLDGDDAVRTCATQMHPADDLTDAELQNLAPGCIPPTREAKHQALLAEINGPSAFCGPDAVHEPDRESAMVVMELDDDGNPTVWCDPHLEPLVRALNAGGLSTVASCCGHGHRPGRISLADGRELMVFPDYDTAAATDRMFPIDINGRQLDVQTDGPSEVAEMLRNDREYAGLICQNAKAEGAQEVVERAEAVLAGIPCYITRNAAMPCTDWIGFDFGKGVWLEAICCLPCRLRAALSVDSGEPVCAVGLHSGPCGREATHQSVEGRPICSLHAIPRDEPRPVVICSVGACAEPAQFEHSPCCTAHIHNKPLCCKHYCRIHFVEVDPCSPETHAQTTAVTK